MVITKKLSPTTFTVSTLDGKKTFHRSLLNIRRVNELVELPTTARAPTLDESSGSLSHQVGDYVIVQEPDADWYSIAQIHQFDETRGWILWIYGSYKGDLTKDLKKVYVKKGRTLYLNERGAEPFFMYVLPSEAPVLFRKHRVTFQTGSKCRRLSKETRKYIQGAGLNVRLQHHSC